jgi:hypothetical protein
MIETLWNVYTWNGAAFVSDGTLPSPNRNFREVVKSNTVVTQLADGDNCLERPSTKAVKSPITWIWQFKNRTELKQKLQNYINNATGLQVECKDSGESYDGDFFGEGFGVEGYLIGDVVAEWVIGRDGNEQLYQITAMFQPFQIS